MRKNVSQKKYKIKMREEKIYIIIRFCHCNMSHIDFFFYVAKGTETSNSINVRLFVENIGGKKK